MPLDLNNLLNSTPVSPPHSNPHQQSNTPSSTEISSALLKRNKLDQQLNIPPSQPHSFYLPAPFFKSPRNNFAHDRSHKQIYQKPIPITSFSYDLNHHIRCADHQFLSIRPLLDHLDHTGFDLNRGFENAIFQDQSLDAGLDGLLISLFDFFDKSDDENKRLDQIRGLQSTKLITWRGILTKLCSSVYESSGSGIQQDCRRVGWTMNVMMIDGTMYIEEGAKEAQDNTIFSGNERPTYYGFSYESLMTNERFMPVNTNQQWVSVVKSNLNGFRILLGGEVDAVDHTLFRSLTQNHTLTHTPTFPPLIDSTDHFVEIKTAIKPASDKDFFNLYRFKLLKFWLQSYLLGTPKIHVGLRDRNGIVCGTETYQTQQIPSIVERQGKPNTRWSSNLCLETGSEIIRQIIQKFESDMHQENPNPHHHHTGAGTGTGTGSRLKFFQDQLNEIVSEEFEFQKEARTTGGVGGDIELSSKCKEKLNGLIDWPVYQLTFIPKPPNNNNYNNQQQQGRRQQQQQSRNMMEIKELDSSQVDDFVLKSKPLKNHFFHYSNPNFDLLSNHPISNNHDGDGDDDNLGNSFHFRHRKVTDRIGFLPKFWLLLWVKLKLHLLFHQYSS